MAVWGAFVQAGGGDKVLKASCHCGAVRIEVEALPAYLNQCGCSVCRRYGTLWGYYRPEQVRLLCSPEATQAYSWGKRDLEFHRCRACGGECQRGCRAGLVTTCAYPGVISVCTVAVWTTMSRSGLSVTAPMGVQSRVCPLQRLGLLSRAAW